MENLTVSLETHLTFRDKTTGKILAIEQKNGHIERYDCSPATNSSSNELFNVNKV